MKSVLPVVLGVALLGGPGAAPAGAQEKGAQETAKPKQETAWTKPPPVQHDLEGRSACLMCHSGAMAQVPAAPASHAGRTNDTCLWCHAPDAKVQSTAPPAVSHGLEGRSACLTCHRPGVMEPVPDIPADHEGRAETFCTLCHAPPKGG